MIAPQVSVIIPVFNEEGSVAQLQMELESALKAYSYELLFVDDGSKDRTIERINRTPGVRVLEFEINTGQSAAMYTGLAAARGTAEKMIPRVKRSPLFMRLTPWRSATR